MDNPDTMLTGFNGSSTTPRFVLFSRSASDYTTTHCAPLDGLVAFLYATVSVIQQISRRWRRTPCYPAPPAADVAGCRNNHHLEPQFTRARAELCQTAKPATRTTWRRRRVNHQCVAAALSTHPAPSLTRIILFHLQCAVVQSRHPVQCFMA